MVLGVKLLVNSQVIFLGRMVGLSRVTVKERVTFFLITVVTEFPSRAETTGTAVREMI